MTFFSFGEMAERALGLSRKIMGAWSATICCTLSNELLRSGALCAVAWACMSLSISASQGVSGVFWFGFH